MEETVTISLSEYKWLRECVLELQALEEGGVDNWTWYSEAQERFEELKKEENL